MRTKADFPIGQPCFYLDKSFPDGVYLRVTGHRPIGDMIIFDSDDKYYQFGLGQNNPFLITIDEKDYKKIIYNPKKEIAI